MKNANPWYVFVVLKPPGSFRIFRCGASLLNRDCMLIVMMIILLWLKGEGKKKDYNVNDQQGVGRNCSTLPL